MGRRWDVGGMKMVNKPRDGSISYSKCHVNSFKSFGMLGKHFMKNNAPTLRWYKARHLSRVKHKKRLGIPKAIRVIDYHKQAAEILQCQYNNEENFRLENDIKNDLFIFTLAGVDGGVFDRGTLDDLNDGTEIIFETDEAMLNRLSPLPKIDWQPKDRFKGKTIGQTLEKYCKYCVKSDNKNYLNSWLKGYSKFLAGWKIKYRSKRPNRFPFADVLQDLHLKKIPFRIECLWDDGFKAILIDQNVHPSRIEVDEFNDKQQFIDPKNFLEVPEIDWVKTFHDTKVEDAAKRMSYYLNNGREKPRLSPKFLEGRAREIREIVKKAIA